MERRQLEYLRARAQMQKELCAQCCEHLLLPIGVLVALGRQRACRETVSPLAHLSATRVSPPSLRGPNRGPRDPGGLSARRTYRQNPGRSLGRPRGRGQDGRRHRKSFRYGFLYGDIDLSYVLNPLLRRTKDGTRESEVPSSFRFAVVVRNVPEAHAASGRANRWQMFPFPLFIFCLTD